MIEGESAGMGYLGIDIGSSSIKGGWLDLRAGEITDVLSEPFPDPIQGLPQGHFEVEVSPIVERARDLIERLLQRNGPCDGIVTCSQMGGIVLTDAAGKLIANYISWRDQRTLEKHPSGCGTYFDSLWEQTTDRDFDVIGRELKAGGGAAILFWLAETGTLPSTPCRAMGLGDYVLAQLCETDPTAEATLALGLIDLSRGDWHRPWFERLGFGVVEWPKLGSVADWVGKYPAGSGKIPCHPAIGDHQAALFGTDLAERELSVNASTGAQVSLLTESWQAGNYQTRPYFAGRYLNTITHLPAGRSLNGLVDLLTTLPERSGMTVPNPWGIISGELEQASHTDLRVDLAFFASAVGDRGSIENIRLENLTVRDLFRAALENMAKNFADAAQRLGNSTAWERIVLSGGICQKLPLLRKLIEKEIPGIQRSVQTSEETLLGLLKLATHLQKREEGSQR